MASLMENLISALKQEEKLYCELIPIAEKKTEAIVKNNLEDLQKITDAEQSILDTINSIEVKRQEVVTNIAVVMNQDPSKLNLQAIVNILQKQPAEQKQLMKVHDDLKKVVYRLKDINIQNKLLIEDSLEMIEFNMNYIRSTRMSSGSSNYTRNASEMDATSIGAGMFDAKQ